MGGSKCHRFTVQKHFARFSFLTSAQYLHQRAFSGAILADQRHYFATLQGKTDIVNRLDAGKTF